MIHAFRFRGLYLALDVESGAIHTLDPDAYAVFRAHEAGSDPYGCGVCRATVDEILAEMDALRHANALDSPQPEPPSVPGGAAIKSLCLHVAHDCNLRCKYCFASTGAFHGERTLMTPEVARRAIDFLLTRSGRRTHLEVDLFGGEPLLNMPVCREIVAYGREREKAYGKRISFTMTTNCVAATQEVVDFVNEHMDNVVISLDGRRDVHDALRPTAAGTGSYDIILERARRLVRARAGKEYYIRGTFTRCNLDFAEDVKALVEAGFDQISLEPVVLPEDDPLSLLPEHLQQIRHEYERLAAYYLTQRRNGAWFNFFHFMIDPENGPCLRKRVTGCGCASEYAAVTPEGDLYPCHQFVGQPGWRMGSVLTDTLDQSVQARFADCNALKKPACRACWAKYHCSGGCPANAQLYSGDLMQPHAMSCELMRIRTECAIGCYVAERTGEA